MFKAIGFSLAVCSFAIVNCFANDTIPRFSIGSQVYPFTVASIMSSISTGSYEPSCKINARYFFSDIIGADLSYGLIYNTGNANDSISKTSANPIMQNQKIEIGIVGNVLNGDRASLSVIAQYGISFQKWYSYYYLSSSSYPTYKYYDVIQNSVFLGIEPTFYLSKNIGLFSSFGLSINFIPNSKSYSSGFSSTTVVPPLLEQKNARTSIATNGCSIGIKYLF